MDDGGDETYGCASAICEMKDQEFYIRMRTTTYLFFCSTKHGNEDEVV